MNWNAILDKIVDRLMWGIFVAVGWHMGLAINAAVPWW